MKSISILDINSFKDLEADSFYCNVFSQHVKAHHKAITIPHKHNFYLCVLFTHGSGTHEIDFNTYKIKPGKVFFLKPGQTHHWVLSEDIEGYILFHSFDFYNLEFTTQSISDFPFYFSNHSSPTLHLNPIESSGIESLFKEILCENYQRERYKKQKINHLLGILYIELSRFYLAKSDQKTANASKNNYYLHQLESHLENNFSRIKSPAAYADLLNISVRHLNRITQELIGKSTTQVINERIILEAKRILLYKEIPLKDVSFQLGFEEYSYFSRVFKQYTGTTPKEFRNSYLNKDSNN
ncbi:AraC family transcriptional regulator [Marinoscillum pacificum]|uniref:AraC family transcriptional regulator n=1 Tax=Marinoscillum pacificum TaxID=392723 RepID=UPI00215732EF|nr:helix-turn-helix domain-containing protein [Marinoscillum pacificum]